MKAPRAGLERCLDFINYQLRPPALNRPTYGSNLHRTAITISRQTGAGGHAVAENLLKRLEPHRNVDSPPWKIYDRNLVEQVLAEHHLPRRLARFMPEDSIPEITDTLDELFGLHPPAWTLVRQTAETILRLAQAGNVILIGRGANVITRKLGNVFHVRLVAPLENRVRHIQELQHLNPKEALEFIQREDLGRRRYVRKYFDADIDEAFRYHLVLNTGLIGPEEAAEIIAQAVMPALARSTASH